MSDIAASAAPFALGSYRPDVSFGSRSLLFINVHKEMQLRTFKRMKMPVALAVAAATLAVGAGPASAAQFSPGGAFGSTGGSALFSTNVGTYQCTTAALSGSLSTATLVPGTSAGTVTSGSFAGCTANASFTWGGFPWDLKTVSVGVNARLRASSVTLTAALPGRFPCTLSGTLDVLVGGGLVFQPSAFTNPVACPGLNVTLSSGSVSLSPAQHLVQHGKRRRVAAFRSRHVSAGRACSPSRGA